MVELKFFEIVFQAKLVKNYKLKFWELQLQLYSFVLFNFSISSRINLKPYFNLPKMYLFIHYIQFIVTYKMNCTKVKKNVYSALFTVHYTNI